MVNGNLKGKAGEREACRAIADVFKLPANTLRRSQQYCGAAGDADVVGIPNLHIECKRVEKLNLDAAIKKVTEECPEGDVPIVVHRRNRKKWRVTVELDRLPELVELLSKLQTKRSIKRRKPRYENSLEQ